MLGKCKCHAHGCLPLTNGEPPAYSHMDEIVASVQATKERLSPLTTAALPAGKTHVVEVRVEEKDVKECEYLSLWNCDTDMLLNA